MIYDNDPIWKQAKAVAKELGFYQDWINCISVYHILGGTQTSLVCRIDDEPYMIYGTLDTNKQVVLFDNEMNIHIKDKELVTTSKKRFTNVDQSRVKSVNYKLPIGTFSGSKEIQVMTRKGVPKLG
jgi:hypothetical protein